MSFKYISSAFVTAVLLAAVLLVAASNAIAQETPLTLLQIVTALQSTSSEMTMSQKNSFITQRVGERGVTFALTPQLKDELTNAGASLGLIQAIRANGPQSNQTSTAKSASNAADVKFDKLWVEQDITRDGRSGMVIHTGFTTYNVKNVPLQLTIRFQDRNGQYLNSTNRNFANKDGELALYKNLKPEYDAVDYDDWSVFVPYGELQLNPGTHNLKIDANIVYADGKLLKHMTTYGLAVTIARASATAPRAKFEKMWVDYGVTENESLGMRIHVNFRTYNLKNTRCWLTISFEKDSGERLVARNTLFADRTGGVTLSSELTPGHVVTNYSDISVFMPYDELNLRKGDYNLKMRADLTYPDGGLIQHLNYHTFTFTQP